MAGFRKAKAEQAALKVGIYGPAGSGKTITALMMAEGIAALTGKRVAMVDTERGSDFYVKDVPERKAHPTAFDIDALYSRSLTEVLTAVKGLSPDEYACVVIDSITHLWESARLAYEGKQTRAGTIPMHAWSQIKRPYKDLMAYLLSSPLHVFILGRMGKDMAEDEETGEMKVVGDKMKAEGETQYEPHILLKMIPIKNKKGDTTYTAYAEKDRTGVLSGRTINLWPGTPTSTFDHLVKPILPLLGDTQAVMQTDDEVGMKDAEALEAAERSKIRASEGLLTTLSARIDLATTLADLKAIGAEITPALKKQMMPGDVTALRNHYQAADRRLSGQHTLEPVEA
jgi:hypothetical protein